MSTDHNVTHAANLVGLRITSTEREIPHGIVIDQNRSGWVYVMLDDGQVREVPLWRCAFVDPEAVKERVGALTPPPTVL